MEENLESIWQDYGLEKLQQGIGSLFPEFKISLSELLQKVMTGDVIGAVTGLLEESAGSIRMQMTGLRNILLWLVLLGIAAAVLTHFAEIFDQHQVADLGYYFMYLLFLTILFQCFIQTADIAEKLMKNIILFMQLMFPTYLIAVGVTSGMTTVNAYSQLMSLMIYGVEQILCRGVTRLVYVYVVLSVVNCIWAEDKLNMPAGLLKKGISFLWKASIGTVTGISIFQTLITPVIDSAKSSVWQKAISALPGIGNVSEGVLELIIGSAVVIKNSIGVVMLLLLLILCVAPLLKIYLIVWILRLAAAVVGMVSDKRLAVCTDQMSEGCMMMLKTAATAMLLFLIVISIIASASNRGF